MSCSRSGHPPADPADVLGGSVRRGARMGPFPGRPRWAGGVPRLAGDRRRPAARGRRPVQPAAQLRRGRHGRADPRRLRHDRQQALLRPLFACEQIWCQLFSEPEAGSDLAALQTRPSVTATAGYSTGTRSGPRWRTCRSWAC